LLYKVIDIVTQLAVKCNTLVEIVQNG